jgi:hypothetical protein
MKNYLAHLLSSGVLLKSDPRLPSVATFVAGAPVRSHAIFRATEELADRPDVVVVKLVSGKDTFVHDQLWPELLAIATANESWQVDDLPADAKNLYRKVQKNGELTASGAAAKLLEMRLLVRAASFHSETGAHKKGLESWSHWADRVGLTGRKLPLPHVAKATFEKRCLGATWPWSRSIRA